MGEAVAVTYIVDGMNVIGSQPDGWWRDRGAARRRLVEDLGVLGAQGHEITVVFDGHPTKAEEEAVAPPGVSVSFAPGGPNAADDAIVDIVGGLEQPAEVVVVTSDRLLVERVHHLGATVEGARAFRSRLPVPEAVHGPSSGRRGPSSAARPRD
jgi:predicted RNA-binding protein with PIN domain